MITTDDDSMVETIPPAYSREVAPYAAELDALRAENAELRRSAQNARRKALDEVLRDLEKAEKNFHAHHGDLNAALRVNEEFANRIRALKIERILMRTVLKECRVQIADWVRMMGYSPTSSLGRLLANIEKVLKP